MAVRAGRYRHRVIVIDLDETQRDEFGGIGNVYVEVQRPWCSISPKMDSEQGLIVDIEMRWSKQMENPSKNMYIVHNGYLYTIDGVVNVLELNEKLRITAKKVLDRVYENGSVVTVRT